MSSHPGDSPEVRQDAPSFRAGRNGGSVRSGPAQPGRSADAVRKQARVHLTHDILSVSCRYAYGVQVSGLPDPRHWTCPACRTRHDRDVNAATNILAAGRAVAGHNPGEACGADMRQQGSSLLR
ncbi:zinc ribbon domain-containing protein, partial [Actinoplanes sp. NPDC049802]|uniref:zinc ribbon domain-containing protein n=1 Tax=Actinoplanes sp. NPDC049802 TaxID=3154742 RepID=UPI0033C859F2